ncbi:DNA-binding transcriptional response regulator, NtrC family, contains REC, AAA-type ATPase, and a Fis-type DNA-binding domains [Desulfocicer vacuolatum DSM 3385]|uniref:DNA-binding transcriptional response regulator, NtrC family, contains REC, AAA-type ATPase, and a Fis-type DNA-binding domains n=1 Tax=Desulfocicer vacuolatum DSM 3385 TaxID=1121400 RepID=A0A1W2D3X8_9BACT|nr:sigma-54 dependent transcriptional regulator [Desulfocicer vacuolatum]SMC91772.1 DNA-binding transcriptional response regulator, NtrC family, contains REC, AAA-type ATPase, and a Fis-type DNA-binding domains [Desulfocicer vacuolatum DSM 3385]
MINFSHTDVHVIIVDDEQSELDAYSFLLQSMGVKHIKTVKDSRNLMGLLESISNAIVFLDLNMPHKSGQEVLADMRELYPGIPVIICTANSDITMAVKCLKLGAHDYLLKPINMNSFGSALRNALEIQSLRNEVMSLKGIPRGDHLKFPDFFSRIITCDSVMQGIFHYIESIAASGQPVLVMGETGAGKELIARAVHDVSQVPGPFVAVDVSGLDDTLFADTLFGHEKGAYTGAATHRSGLLERADNGTIFLDEIGDLSRVSQIKLLRLLQEGIYYPLGCDEPRQCRARIITAANRELNRSMGQDHGFRMDLYYRLSTHLIRIPPLRERREDISLLVDHLIHEAANSMGKEITAVDQELLPLLKAHPFPGNVRELKTYIYDAVAQCNTSELTAHAVKDRLSQSGAGSLITMDQSASLASLFGHFPTLSELTEYAVDKALDLTEYNQTQAATLLGISKQALSKRLQKRKKACRSTRGDNVNHC